MSYQAQGGGAQDEEIELLNCGDTLNSIRDEMNNKFVNLAQNMEYQLTKLRKELAKEKQITADLREKLKYSKEQTEEFKQECTEKTNDLNQINGFYANNSDPSEFQSLLNQVIERHQAFVESLKACNYS